MGPVVLIDGKWWFWDVARLYKYGPYDTQFKAEIAYAQYVANWEN